MKKLLYYFLVFWIGLVQCCQVSPHECQLLFIIRWFIIECNRSYKTCYSYNLVHLVSKMRIFCEKFSKNCKLIRLVTRRYFFLRSGYFTGPRTTTRVACRENCSSKCKTEHVIRSELYSLNLLYNSVMRTDITDWNFKSKQSLHTRLCLTKYKTFSFFVLDTDAHSTLSP